MSRIPLHWVRMTVMLLLLAGCDALPVASPTPAALPATPSPTPNPTPIAAVSAFDYLPSADHSLYATLIFSAAPAMNRAPLDVIFTVSLVGQQLGNCASGPGYDFGDGTKSVAITNSCPVAPLTTVPTPLPPYTYSFSTSHRYDRPGVYRATTDWSTAIALTVTVQ